MNSKPQDTGNGVKDTSLLPGNNYCYMCGMRINSDEEGGLLIISSVEYTLCDRCSEEVEAYLKRVANGE